jgi:hypothetical protein
LGFDSYAHIQLVLEFGTLRFRGPVPAHLLFTNPRISRLLGTNVLSAKISMSFAAGQLAVFQGASDEHI